MPTVEEIIATLAAEDRVCPRADKWVELFDMLPNHNREGVNGKIGPPPPLILAACGESNSTKHHRLEDQLRHAKENGVLDKVVSFLMSLSADEWECGDINSTSHSYPTYDDSANGKLLFSAECDDLEGMEAALESGADINTYNEDGETPLIISARENFLPGVKFLLDSGADLNRSGDGALHSAILNDSMEIAHLLVSMGVSLTIPDPSGWTSLTYAAYLSSPETLSWVLSHKVEIDKRDLSGMTPLIHAACSGSVKKVSMLLDAGADKELRDFDGWLAIDWAREIGHEDVTNLLI